MKTTKEELILRAGLPKWQTCEPPKDGTRIVAFGRVIASDAFSTAVEPFSGIIHWENFDSGHAGWCCRGLSVKQDLADEVKIDYWNNLPSPELGNIFSEQMFEDEPQ